VVTWNLKLSRVSKKSELECRRNRNRRRRRKIDSCRKGDVRKTMMKRESDDNDDNNDESKSDNVNDNDL